MPRGLTWSDLDIGETIGEGQAGIVRVATVLRPRLGLRQGTRVAIKQYKPWICEQPGQMERLVRELEIGRRVRHPNLVRSYSIVWNPVGLPALVMGVVNGSTLESVLELIRNGQRKSMPLTSIVCILRDVTSALAALHAAGVLHRDLKPANIMLTGDNAVLMDLGVVSSVDFPEQTETGRFLGTIRYAAPEYLVGHSATAASDMFSLGAIAYELLSERRYLGEETNWARLINLIAHPPWRWPQLEQVASNRGFKVTDYLEHFIRATILSPRDRWSAEELLHLCDPQLLDQGFYLDGRNVVKGEPICRGEWFMVETPLARAADLIIDKLSEEARDALFHQFEYGYWKREVNHSITLYPDPESATTHELEAAKLIECGGVDSASDIPYGVSELARQLYRYGYLARKAAAKG